MKQFARCMNCQQWYVRAVTVHVEVWDGAGLHATTIWCLRCIAETEQRSQVCLPGQEPYEVPPAATRTVPTQSEHMVTVDGLQAYRQEHRQLMDRALQDDDSTLVPVIEDFLARGRAYQGQLDTPEDAQRLTNDLQYWEAFLRALKL